MKKTIPSYIRIVQVVLLGLSLHACQYGKQATLSVNDLSSQHQNQVTESKESPNDQIAVGPQDQQHGFSEYQLLGGADNSADVKMASDSKAQSSQYSEFEAQDIPDEYLCPITQEIMVDPVVAADGHSYERKAIEGWLKRGNKTSPMTNKRLNYGTVTPNHTLRNTIEEFNRRLPSIQRRNLLQKDLELAIKLREESIERLQKKIAERDKKESREEISVEIQSAFDTTIPIDQACPQLKEKLKDSLYKLSKEESINLLMTCITYGEENAKKARGKELVIVIGNTGAGKSTFVNYLAGCEMIQKSPKSVGVKGYKKVLVVKPKVEGGPMDELMPIGHKRKSKTFMPHIETIVNNATYCDCPGFLDNRGAEINIANAVNIRRTLSEATKVKVIILIAHNPNDVRQLELDQMLHICSSLFGGVENIEKHKDAILLGVSKVSPRDDEFDAKGFKGLLAEDAPKIMEVLADRVFFFDPLDRPIEGAWTRAQCLKEIGKLKPIENPNEILKTVLTDSDKNALINIAEDLQRQIFQLLEKGKAQKASSVYSHLLKLRLIDHPVVESVLSIVKFPIHSYYRQLVALFREHCGFKRFEEADKLLKELRLVETQKHFPEADLQEIYKTDRLAEIYAESHVEYMEQQRRKKEIEEDRKRLKAAEENMLRQEREIATLLRNIEKRKKQAKEDAVRLNNELEDRLKKNEEEFEKHLSRMTQERNKLEQRFKERLENKEKELRRIEDKLNSVENDQKKEHDQKKLYEAIEQLKSEYRVSLHELDAYNKKSEKLRKRVVNSIKDKYKKSIAAAQDTLIRLKWDICLGKAKNGSMRSQYELGMMYYRGHGRAIEQNHEEAFKWFYKAGSGVLRSGHAASQLQLGIMYEHGHGVAQSNKDAIYWYSQSAKQGNASARDRLENMRRNGRAVLRHRPWIIGGGTYYEAI